MIAVRNLIPETKICLVCGNAFEPSIPDEDVCSDCQLTEGEVL